jgi:rubrerythrin
MESSSKPVCRRCEIEMKHHTVNHDELRAARGAASTGRECGGILEDFHACPVCGAAETKSQI